jgi:type I restriction enzyme M protein
MPKLKKLELRAHLLRSIQILKRSLDYTSYCYFILAMIFVSAMGPISVRGDGLRLPLFVSSIPRLLPATAYQRKRSDGYDELAETFSTIEKSNPLLKDVLVPALSAERLSDATLREYLEHLAYLHENTPVFSNVDSFSQAYEYWIEQLAAATIKRGVSFYTQRSLARLLVELVKPTEAMSIYDPSVGTGGLLIEAAQYVRQHGGNADAMRLYGREKLHTIWAICKMNLMVHQMWDVTIEQGDTLQTPPDMLGTFDVILQDLPLSPDMRITRREEAAYLRHALQSLSPQGRAAILSPASLMQHDHGDFWRYALSRDWLEAVISLPPKLLHGTQASAYVLVFNKEKTADHQGHVLFVEAKSDAAPRSRINHLEGADIARIVEVFDHWRRIADFARIVPISQIEDQNYSLSVTRYIEWVETPKYASAMTALKRYKVAVQRREEAVSRLMKGIEGLNDQLTPFNGDDSAI